MYISAPVPPPALRCKLKNRSNFCALALLTIAASCSFTELALLQLQSITVWPKALNFCITLSPTCLFSLDSLSKPTAPHGLLSHVLCPLSIPIIA